MKINVEFLGPIDKEETAYEVESLEALKTLLQKEEALQEWLESVSVALNGKIISSFDQELKEGDTVSILPPVCGG